MRDQEELERHPDPIDTASEIEARIVNDGIESARRIYGPKATGYCLNPRCEEPLVSDEVLQSIKNGQGTENIKRWCNSECRDHWQRDVTMRKIGGIVDE